MGDIPVVAPSGAAPPNTPGAIADAPRPVVADDGIPVPAAVARTIIPAEVAAAPVIGAQPVPNPVHAVHIVAGAGTASFPGYPKMRYHPVYPPVLVADPNSAALLPDADSWRDTQEEALISRTYAETQLAQSLRRNAEVDAYEKTMAARHDAAKAAG